MKALDWTLTSASAAALFAAPAVAQTADPSATTQSPAEQGLPDPQADATEAQGAEVVVTGYRQSLERATQIKRTAPQVVDSIVAEDIGKFPDPTTAAALQRVPGVQVTVGGNNEITGVVIRGLGDILTTLDGRELFSTTGRTFSFQDLPSEALARVDVIKSSTANLVEGGIAGITDLQLNKAFNFREPTLVLTARGNYASNVEKLTPQLGALVTDRWDTGIGEIGALLNVSWYHTKYNRPALYVPDRRSTAIAPFNTPGLALPVSGGGFNNYGWYERPQANGSIQWQATPELEVYVDGLFAGYRSDNNRGFYETQFFNANTGLSNVTTGECFDARVNAAGFNPNQAQLNAGLNQPGGYQIQNFCDVTSATITNPTAFTAVQALRERTNNYLGAFGMKYEAGPAKLLFDIAYQESAFTSENFTLDIGKRIPTLIIDLDDRNAGRYTQVGNPMLDATDMRLRNGSNQNFQRSDGDLLQARIDGSYDLDGLLGFLQSAQIGLRFADRGAEFNQAQVNRPAPGGDLAVPLASLNLPADFFILSPGINRINNGAPQLMPNPDVLRTPEGRDFFRGVFGAPLGDPPYDPQRRFVAAEKTYASYLQLGYEFGLGGLTVDGLVGVRPTRTERTITGGALVTIPGTPPRTEVVFTTAETTDTDVLPNASARVQFGGGFQARATYAKAIRRPDFGSLNPGISYVLNTNPNVLAGGSAGNPNLRPQISDSYDATLEYYFGRGNYIAVAGYYRDIRDRVISSAAVERIDGIDYTITRPRNVGAAELKGVEVSGQTFFDFLPGALAGLGVFGNYTYADTEVKGQDRLAGLPLQGVSKHNFNAGLLYERFGLSGRLIYTYRGSYYNQDGTGLAALRPLAPGTEATAQSPLLVRVRPAGRLDFGVGYEINETIRVDVGGTNINRAKLNTYFDPPGSNRDIIDDDSIYTVGVRARF